MKRVFGFFLFLLCFSLTRLSAFSLTFTDNFTRYVNNNIQTYTNLSPFNMDGPYWGSLPDRNTFSFTSTATPSGYATYRVQHAETVTVAFYSLQGSFYTWADEEGCWIQGKYNENMSSLEGKKKVQAGFSPSTGAIYADIGGVLHAALYTDAAYYVLREPAVSPPDSLVGYGINVYASANGRSWARIPLSYTTVYFHPSAPFCYDELTGKVPEGARFLRVELNDATKIPLESGGVIEKAPGSFNCIASVTITGQELVMGIPEPLLPLPEPEPEPELEPEPDVSSSAASKSSSSQSSRKATGSTGAAGSGKAPASSNSSSRYEGSKFEGVITSSSKSAASSRAASKESAQTSPSSAPSSSAGEDQIEPHPAPLPVAETAVYQINTKNDDDKAFTAGVSVYIIVVTGALVFIVLSSHSKRK